MLASRLDAIRTFHCQAKDRLRPLHKHTEDWFGVARLLFFRRTKGAVMTERFVSHSRYPKSRVALNTMNQRDHEDGLPAFPITHTSRRCAVTAVACCVRCGPAFKSRKWVIAASVITPRRNAEPWNHVRSITPHPTPNLPTGRQAPNLKQSPGYYSEPGTRSHELEIREFVSHPVHFKLIRFQWLLQ